MADELSARLLTAYPELETVREVAPEPVYVAGGAVRDLLLGRGRADLDLVVVGDAAALAAALGAEVVRHERFATAKARLDGHEIDIATARTEAYARPGALPDVSPAATIEEDLSRRDFTINAMAVPLAEPRLLDPHGGRADLEEGVLRVLHERSFADDPTRAIRAARYAARFGFGLSAETEERVRIADLGTVSADRRAAELLRLAGERGAARGLELLAGWGLIEPRDGGIELAAKVADLLATPPWQGFAPPAPAVLHAALGTAGGAEHELARAEPGRPSEAVELAGGRSPVELVVARAMGAAWLDRYLREWREVALEIDGEDLIAAGVAQGPAIGRGLAEARRRKLDGEIDGRDEELAAALVAACEG